MCRNIAQLPKNAVWVGLNKRNASFCEDTSWVAKGLSIAIRWVSIHSALSHLNTSI